MSKEKLLFNLIPPYSFEDYTPVDHSAPSYFEVKFKQEQQLLLECLQRFESATSQQRGWKPDKWKQLPSKLDTVLQMQMLLVLP
mmetsp:Transcript_18763/g.26018  ORF Transcript_18763/g.26018 Transcript_18763/m.26018 type:complete len:84 (+) Transcript_18763:456-707(+)